MTEINSLTKSITEKKEIQNTIKTLNGEERLLLEKIFRCSTPILTGNEEKYIFIQDGVYGEGHRFSLKSYESLEEKFQNTQQPKKMGLIERILKAISILWHGAKSSKKLTDLILGTSPKTSLQAGNTDSMTRALETVGIDPQPQKGRNDRIAQMEKNSETMKMDIDRLKKIVQETKQKVQSRITQLRSPTSLTEEERLEKIHTDIDHRIKEMEFTLESINNQLGFFCASIEPFSQAKIKPSHLNDSIEMLESEKNRLESLIKELNSELKNVRKKFNSYVRSDMKTHNEIVKDEREQDVFVMEL